MKAHMIAPDTWRSLDDLALSIRIARAARAAAQSAGRELDALLEEVAEGHPPTADRLLASEQRWLDARALADATNEAFVRTRTRQEELRRRAHDLAMPSLRPYVPRESRPPASSAAVDRSALTQRSARPSWSPVEARAASPPRSTTSARSSGRADPRTQN